MSYQLIKYGLELYQLVHLVTLSIHHTGVVIPQNTSWSLGTLSDYLAKLKDSSTSGAVFFAVCRGKVSEGLDFADHAGRAVVVTGMPYATRTDPKVRLKREYLDQQAQSHQIGCKVVTGEEWYSQQAIRAVNQAVGRVIRHRHDYGAIIFCDERFAHSSRQSQISLWIQPHIKCYSRFGDVVFKLTRFFRDGAIQGPTKVELTRSEDHGNVSTLKTAQSMDKHHQEKYRAPLLSSSKAEVKGSTISSQWAEILPANRSSLTSYKQVPCLTLKRSSDLLCCEKKMFMPGRKSIHQKNHIVDLTSDSSADEETIEELITPCSLKKHRVELQLAKHIENSCHASNIVKEAQLNNAPTINYSVKHEKSTKIKRMEFLSQKSKASLSTPAPSGDEERRGSAFLSQVQEKLSDSEYTEFVGFMKALKSKAMKIGEVFQCIVRLFSSPDRLPLLQRFKNYVPAKYHSLYEQYLRRSDDT